MNCIFILFDLEQPKNFPTTTSIRLIYIFWCFAGLVITNYYAAFMYSIMTIPIDNSAIDTIEKLANEQANGKIQVTVVEHTSYQDIFKVKTTFKYFQLIYILGSKNRTQL